VFWTTLSILQRNGCQSFICNRYFNWIMSFQMHQHVYFFLHHFLYCASHDQSSSSNLFLKMLLILLIKSCMHNFISIKLWWWLKNALSLTQYFLMSNITACQVHSRETDYSLTDIKFVSKFHRGRTATVCDRQQWQSESELSMKLRIKLLMFDIMSLSGF